MNGPAKRRTLRIPAGPTDRGASLALAVDIMTPAQPVADAKLIVCIPGGGVSRRYYDLEEGHGRSISFASAMLAAGHTVALIDPPGTGESDTIEDPFELTVAVQAPILARIVAALRAEVPEDMAVVGVGHSAGAMLTAAVQAQARCYDALGLFCFGTGGLPKFLQPEWLTAVAADPIAARDKIPHYARLQFGAPAFSPHDGESSGARVLGPVLSPVLASVALQAMSPNNIAPELASIDVPLFTALGDRDMLGPPHLLGQAYASCADFTQIIVADAGHHVFLSPNAPALFTRFAAWLQSAISRPSLA